MKKMIIALAVVALATSAFAQIDPDANGIGFYFDDSAMENCATTVAPFSPINGYLIATNIDQTSGISGFEC